MYCEPWSEWWISPARRPAPLDGHLQRVDDELRAHVVGHRPADDPAAVGVLDRGQVQPALPGPQVGHVRDPEHGSAPAGENCALDEVIGDPDARAR